MAIIILLANFIFCSQENNQVIDPRFETPEKTLTTYWAYLKDRDYKNALGCFSGFKDSYYDSSLIYPLPDIESLQIDSFIQHKEISRKEVIIFYRIKFYSKIDKTWKSFTTGDKLVFTKTGWKIKDVIITK
jgi:hypothetical protein